jgi:hypothetical protein
MHAYAEVDPLGSTVGKVHHLSKLLEQMYDMSPTSPTWKDKWQQLKDFASDHVVLWSVHCSNIVKALPKYRPPEMVI